jgi:hypothetical protein
MAMMPSPKRLSERHMSDKKDMLSVVKPGDVKFKSIKLGSMKVYNYRTAAVVTGTAARDETFKGQTLAPEGASEGDATKLRKPFHRWRRWPPVCAVEAARQPVA